MFDTVSSPVMGSADCACTDKRNLSWKDAPESEKIERLRSKIKDLENFIRSIGEELSRKANYCEIEDIRKNMNNWYEHNHKDDGSLEFNSNSYM